MQLHHFLGFVFGQACLGAALSLPERIIKRGPETNATLYAYGANASAWPVTYSLTDGNAHQTVEPL